MRRIALFGGTFDPPHCGHMAIAKAAADALVLDEVLFAPTGQQPLKLHAPVTPFLDRLGLVAAACTADSRFSVTDIDGPRGDHKPNYTVDTLTALREMRPNDALFNLVGADSFLTLRQWKDSERLLELAEWIVATRPGYALDLIPFGLSAALLKRVHLLTNTHEDVSATELRERLRRGEECRDLVPTAVLAYIKEQGLYRAAT